MLMTPTKSMKVKEPKAPKKPTLASNDTETLAPKPKRKKSETKKAKKEPDRKILVAVDL